MILPLLGTLRPDEAEAALQRLPMATQQHLSRMSPMTYLDDIHAPLIVIGHDRDDNVIPVDESRRLSSALSGRRGVHYTEFGMFQHADPTLRKLPRARLLQELANSTGTSIHCSGRPSARREVSARGVTPTSARRASLAQLAS